MPNDYGEIFEVELKCWCHGLSKVRDNIDRSVLYQVITEFAPVLREAIQHLYVCDILATARRLITSGRCNASEKEIAFYILSHLPTPAELSKEQAGVLASIVDQVEKAYGGALKRLEKKWKAAQSSDRQSESGSQVLQALAMPPKPLSFR